MIDESDYEISLEKVKKRAVSGVAILTARTFLLNAISFLAQGLLWLFIEPSDFGVFILVSATINFLSYFADIGLGAALIQKKEKPKDEDFKTVFLVQEFLVILVCLAILAFSPVIARINSFSSDAVMLLYALTAAFFLASLKNIPSIILERKLEFAKFVLPQVLENVVYNITLVYFAWRGYGITSFTYAVLLRGVVGVVAIYAVQPWKPGLAFSKESLRNLLRFGVPYQVNNLLATVKDDAMTIVLGSIIGSFGLGILGTAQKLVQYPLRFFMDNVTKVAFPAFSRMQDDRKTLAKSLTRSVFFVSSLVFPSLVGLVVVFPTIVEVIPKYKKWELAYVPVIILSVNAVIASVTTQLTNLLNSIGDIKLTMKFMVMWTILTWFFVPAVAYKWGVNGASVGYMVVGVSSFLVFVASKRRVDWSIYESVVRPIIASLIMGFLVFVFLRLTPQNLTSLVSGIVLGAVLYVTILYLLVGKSLPLDVKKIVESIIRKSF